MNINKEILNDLLANPEKIESISLESLEQLSAEFPYFIGIQKLINTKKKQIKDANELNGLQKKVAFVNNFQPTTFNNNFDKEDDDDEFTDLEMKEKDLPFENFDAATENKVTFTENTVNDLSNKQIETLQILAGSAIYYCKDDLNMLPHLSETNIASLSKAGITCYQQLVNVFVRNGSEILSQAFKLTENKIEEIADFSKALFQNKYQKLLIENIGFSNYNNKKDLKQVVGIGDLLENKLNQVGVFNYKQLINLEISCTEFLTALIDYFPGRIERDKWQQQAKKLDNPVPQITLTEKPTGTIEHLAEKLESRKNKTNNLVESTKEIENTAETGDKTFLDWLNSFDEKKNYSENNKSEKLTKKSSVTINNNDEQPRLVKVNEENLKEIHTFLGNKVEDYQAKKPIFEFLPGFSVKEVAAKSLNEDQSIVSLTLAKIYEKQQYFDKAINIYQKLILKYPEKSGFFAGQIDVLKQQI